MRSPTYATIDGNTAAAHVAYQLSEIIAIYPITPSSTMAEIADAKACAGEQNIWGAVPSVTQMQSEGGAAGALHGAMTTGALTTSFTASQGLLLMIPNMYKVAGELTPCVLHITARAIATQGLSIFGDHGDVMAARSTGWAMLASASVQEAMDMAAISHAASLESRLPFMHFFDGFRTSHEIQKIEMLDRNDLRALINEDCVRAHRQRGLSPERPSIRGTAHNPDVYFQGREVCNPYYEAAPELVQASMDALAERCGRQYHLFDYVGAADADRVIIAMGSACETLTEVVEYMVEQGEKVGLIIVRLFRPFSVQHLLAALPQSTRTITVLDRCKEPGASGEPLYQDIITSLTEAYHNGALAQLPRTLGGRYGLGSKEFDPGMAKAVYDNMQAETPKNHFTIGILDDVSGSSLTPVADFHSESDSVHRALFYGLGSDGTVGANKNSITIIGDGTNHFCQGYFVYDSKKSGSMTVSHLRFSPNPIRSTYLVNEADFVACHSFPFLERYAMVERLRPGGVFLLNAPNSGQGIWNDLPRSVQEQLITKQARFYAIDAYALGRELGLGGRINVIMQTCFFAISGVLPRQQAQTMIEQAVHDTYGKKGPKVVEMNIRAARMAAERLIEIPLGEVASSIGMRPPVSEDAPDFVRNVIGPMAAGLGDQLPVSAMPADGTWPSGTACWEKRAIAQSVPTWDPDLCIQCNQCSFVCPHGTIRPKIYDRSYSNGSSPNSWRHTPAKGKGLQDLDYTIQVSAEDCTGCGACVHVCPGMERGADRKPTGRKALTMQPLVEVRSQEVANWEHFVSIPGQRAASVPRSTVKGSQFEPVRFEFSGACAGCGETPYISLLTALFGDRALIANATGCSSIYGGNLPTTPYTSDDQGRGPAWSNSLFEDNAEFGLGMQLTNDFQSQRAQSLLRASSVSRELKDQLLAPCDGEPEEVARRRALIDELQAELRGSDADKDRDLAALAEYLVPRSQWIVGGDGWAYDIGFGGLDHVLASGRNVNVLVLDTGVYSNTGGQSSKATPRAAVAKFAAHGKDAPRKDLGQAMMSYGTIFVAQVAYGANQAQVVKAFMEAEQYPGPSLIIAYSHCIAHGIAMDSATDLHKEAVSSGFWPLYRFDPRRRSQGHPALQLDSKAPSTSLDSFLKQQGRFRILTQADPQHAGTLAARLGEDCQEHYRKLQAMAGI